MQNDASADQADPFAMLRSSHRRLEERLRDLAAATVELDDPARAAQARMDCDEVLGYFGRSVARHEEDEERSLFPRLADFDAFTPVIAALAADHQAQHALVDELAVLLDAKTPTLDAAALRSLVARFQSTYAQHIAREENELFPEAERLLGPDSREDMAMEMASRRGRGGGGGGNDVCNACSQAAPLPGQRCPTAACDCSTGCCCCR